MEIAQQQCQPLAGISILGDGLHVRAVVGTVILDKIQRAGTRSNDNKAQLEHISRGGAITIRLWAETNSGHQ